MAERSSQASSDASSMPRTDAAAYAEWEALAQRELNGAPAAERLVDRLLDGVDLPAMGHAGLRSADDARCEPVIGGPRAVENRHYARGVPAATWLAELREHVAHGPNSVWFECTPATSAASLRAKIEAAAVDDAEWVPIVRLAAGDSALPAAAITASLLRAIGVAPPPGADVFAADPLGTLARVGELPVSIESAYDAMAALAAWTARTWPDATSVRVSTVPYHDAGATTVQDLAAALATFVAYLRALTARGLDVDTAASQVALEVRVDSDPFISLAKLRAARLAWTRVVETCGGSRDCAAVRLHVRTTWRGLTRRDRWSNLLRGCAGAFAALAGGADSVAVEPFNAPVGQSSSLGRRMARNTLSVLIDEAHMGRVADPAAGSWSLERLTDDLAHAAWDAFRQIEGRGGMAAVLLDGWWHEQVDRARAEGQGAVNSRRRPINGVTKYPVRDEPDAQPAPMSAPDAHPARGAERDAPRVEEALAALREAVVGGGLRADAFDAAVAAAEAGATAGEISQAWHGPKNATPLPRQFVRHRFAEPFEALQEAVDWHAAGNDGSRPGIVCLIVGEDASAAARADFAEEVAALGGLDATRESTAATGPTAPIRGGGRVSVLCVGDTFSVEHAGEWVRACKDMGAARVLLAGRPDEQWRAAGVDGFVYRGADLLELLSDWHRVLLPGPVGV